MEQCTAMDGMIFTPASIQAGQNAEFRKIVRLRVFLGDFHSAAEAVRTRPQWKTDPEAVRQLGVILHCFARRWPAALVTYSCARYLYRRSVTLSSDTTFDAEALASAATVYLEEGKLCEADLVYRSSLAVDTSSRFALLGRISVACSRRSIDGTRRTCRELIARISTWHQDHEVVAILSTNPHYAFLRSSPSLFYECFGGHTEDLQALHNKHRLERLQHELDARETNSGACTQPLTATGSSCHVTRQTTVSALASSYIPQALLLSAAYNEVAQACPSTVRAHDTDYEVSVAPDAYFAAVY